MWYKFVYETQLSGNTSGREVVHMIKQGDKSTLCESLPSEHCEGVQTYPLVVGVHPVCEDCANIIGEVDEVL